ncbi:MAG TPA: ubiquinone/menaquinone biosynthesis methyltransferase, partial [Polyangiaceae bacterium]|nr:ubiquinone/menaquinone biosynthesis methyltransferase [Polyangiaceae bacterium]
MTTTHEVDRPVAGLEGRRGVEAEHGAATRAMFDRLAGRYDRMNRVLSAGVDARWRRTAVAELGPLPEGPLLDLCAGTLDLAALFERTFAGRDVVAADFSAEMLERGRARGITRRTRTVVADAMKLPFERGEFAGAAVAFGLRNVADPPRALAELRRVLRPGGRLAVLEFFKPAGAGAKLFFAAYGRAVIPTVGRLLAGDGEAYRYLVESTKGFYERSEFERELGLAGFLCVRGRELFPLGIASLV